jgi:hypothetical protein
MMSRCAGAFCEGKEKAPLLNRNSAIAFNAAIAKRYQQIPADTRQLKVAGALGTPIDLRAISEHFANDGHRTQLVEYHPVCRHRDIALRLQVI